MSSKHNNDQVVSHGEFGGFEVEALEVAQGSYVLFEIKSVLVALHLQTC